MPPPWNENRLTAKLGIDYPVIQGPLGGLSSQKLTAAVSNFGGLGSFGAHGLAPEAIKDVVGEIRSLTSKPFAMNLKKAGHTALTKGFTGRLVRGIHNRLLEELNQEETPILPYPLQRRLVRDLAIPAEAAGRSDLLPLWAGQSASLSTCTDVLAFLTSLVGEISEIGDFAIQWSAARRQNQSLK